MKLIEILLLVAAFYMHWISDFVLQGCLADLKRKDWWSANAPDKKYKDDWGMAMFVHGMSWSISVALPYIVYGLYVGNRPVVIAALCSLPVNTIVHEFVDSLKCNSKCISLWTDQTIHLFQIAALGGLCAPFIK